MKKNHFIIIFLLGIFLTPGLAMACENNHSKMKCCNKEMPLKNGKIDCCNNNSHSKSKNSNACNGKCGSALCNTSINNLITFYGSFEMKCHNFNFTSEKQKFYPSETDTSAGYSSIWLIPKIS